MNYQEALEFMGEVRAGMAWERFCVLSIRHAEALIDFLGRSGEARRFLAEKNIDEEYVREQARQILERMHFNVDRDFYLTLGLSHAAAEGEIRRRWKELMSLYHPDRDLSGAEGAERIAVRINEAYNALKDRRKREAYDARFVRAGSAAADPVHHQGAHGKALSPFSDDIFSARFKKTLLKVLVPAFALAAVIVVAVVYIRERDAREMLSLTKQETTPQAGAQEDENNPPLLPAPSAVKSPLPEMTEKARIASSQGIASSVRVQGGPGTPEKETIKTPPAAVLPLKKEDIPPKRSDPPPAGAVSPQPPIQRSLPEDPKREAGITVAAVLREETKKALEEAAGKSTESSPARRMNPNPEVFLLLGQYVNAYEKGTRQEFMDLFSDSLVQKSLEVYDDMRRNYQAKYGKSHKFVLKDIELWERDGRLSVRSTYEVERLGAPPQAAEQGVIEYHLVRERGSLRIAGLQHDRR